MFQNYLMIMLRNLRKEKFYAGLNIAGLALGLTCCLLIALYVLDESAYDAFHEKADRIVLLRQFETTGTSGGKLATDLQDRFAQIERAVRLKNTNALIAFGKTAAYEEAFFFADSSVFDVFTLPLVAGNPRTALAERYGVVISEKMAEKYFPGTDPMGQILRYDGKHSLHVTGVMRDLPSSSHHRIEFLASYASANELIGWDVTTNHWGGSTWTYLLLAPGTGVEALQAQLPDYVKSLNDPNAPYVWKMSLVPLRNLYLKTDLVASNRLTYVYIFSAVALLILGLASFNYINLSTARATGRAKEVGVRKVLGSSFGQLLWQFLAETTFFVVLSVALACALTYLALPAFNQLSDKQLSLGSLLTPHNLAGLLAATLLLSLLTGLYPAFVLSGFRPAAALKGRVSAGGGRPWLRHALVVGQFAVSVVMIVATLVVYNQLHYIQTKNLGYQREQILVVALHGAPEKAKQLFKEQVQSLPGVVSATQSYTVPGSGALRHEKMVSDYVPKGAADASISHLTIDENFLKTYGIRLVQGRNLDSNRPADRKAFLINQSAMKYLGWKDLSGKMMGYYTFEYNPDGSYREVPQRGPVVGVIEDYHQTNLKNTIPPLIYSLNAGYEDFISVKLAAGSLPGSLRQVEGLWKRSFPDQPFDYEFMDDFFTRTYQAEQRTGKVFGLFAGLAVTISCLGLFGLVAFSAQLRTKEIGIRKVLGASVSSLISLLSGSFIRLVLVALVLATPVAWYAMHQWLLDFAYKTEIHWWIFVLAGALSLLIALLTVSYQAARAAIANPVESLRSE
jgi:putative ABC transport system permease protein